MLPECHAGGPFGDDAEYALNRAHSAENATATMSSLQSAQFRKVGGTMSKPLSVVAFAFAIAALAVQPVQSAEPLYNWTGVYVGANAGYGWGRSKTSETFAAPAPLFGTPGAVLAASTSRFSLNGAIGGGQIGYNWQSNRIVYGIEADIQMSNQKGGTSFACPVPQIGQGCNELVAAGYDGYPPTVAFNQSLQWFGTVRARVGALVTPDTLAYLTGGLAYGEIKTEGVATGYRVNTIWTSPFSHTTTKAGWTIGAGMESRLFGQWTGRLEYLYVDFGTVSGTARMNNFPPLNFAYSSRISDSILRAGLSYKFGEPAAAKD
jgi:outer membrane immunogenic protein